MPYNKIVAARLREIRKKRGLTQAEVAEGVGVSRSTVTSWEAGIRELNMWELADIREFFCVSSDYLLGLTDNCTTINISNSYNFDLNKLNALGKRQLFEYYNFLVQNETYVK